MARADLLIDSIRAGAEGNQELFRRVLEAPITPVSLNGASRLLLELRPQCKLADLFRQRLLLVGPPGNGTVFPYHQASVESRAGIPWRSPLPGSVQFTPSASVGDAPVCGSNPLIPS
jgi:hypothetical protein